MKNTTRIAIAALLHSAGKVLSALAFEFGGTEATGEPETTTPEQPAEEKPKRGRKPAATAATPETPATPVTPPEPTETAATNGTGKTYEDMKALIDPLVKAGQGLDVRKAISKYSPEGGLRMMDPKHYADFEKDIAELSY